MNGLCPFFDKLMLSKIILLPAMYWINNLITKKALISLQINCYGLISPPIH